VGSSSIRISLVEIWVDAFSEDNGSPFLRVCRRIAAFGSDLCFRYGPDPIRRVGYTYRVALNRREQAYPTVAANVAIPATTKLNSLTGNMTVLNQIRPKDKSKF